MKLSLVRVLPVIFALLVPSLALAEEPSAPKAGDSASHKPHVTQTAKRAKGASSKRKAKASPPKAAKKAPKAAKKAPKASKKAAK
jgi:hypothetical protein